MDFHQGVVRSSPAGAEGKTLGVLRVLTVALHQARVLVDPTVVFRDTLPE